MMEVEGPGRPAVSPAYFNAADKQAGADLDRLFFLARSLPNTELITKIFSFAEVPKVFATSSGLRIKG